MEMFPVFRQQHTLTLRFKAQKRIHSIRFSKIVQILQFFVIEHRILNLIGVSAINQVFAHLLCVFNQEVTS